MMTTKYKFRNILMVSILIFNISMLQAQDAGKIISSIKSEVDRNKSELKIDKLLPPFYISYAVIDFKYLDIKASLGTLSQSFEYTRRMGYPSLQVGSYERSSLGYIDMNSYYRQGYPKEICLDDNPVGIATGIWRDLDEQYKNAAENYEAKQAIIRQQKQTEEEKKLVDFEKTPPINLTLQPEKLNMNKAYWENYAIKASEILKKYPEISNSTVNISVRDVIVYYYNTENSQYTAPIPYYKIHLNVSAMTEDGQEISDDLFVEHAYFDKMPDLKTFSQQCEDFISDFIKLKNAPLIDDAYSGPVLFEKMAVAEAFQQQFFMQQQSLIAKRKPVSNDDMNRYYGGNDRLNANNLEMMLDKKIISRSLTIKSLSGSESYNGVKLDGYFQVDAEGVVPAKELTLVDNGVLKNMLNGRTPTKKITHSNGHARFDYYNLGTKIAPGNMLLASKETYSNEDLKKKLLDAAKEEDFDYAYIVRRLRGNNVLGIYKVYVADGREELVRGANLADFNMKSFKRVLGASDKNFMYNTASFGVITSYIVPEALLFEELEVTRNGNLTFKSPYVVPQPTAATIK